MSICTLSASDTLATIVEALLPRGASANWTLPEGGQCHDPSQPSQALYIVLDLRGSVHSDDGDSTFASEVVHLIIERPTNYTKVFAHVNDDFQLPKPEQFVMRSDHDSCWRTDGFRDVDQSFLHIQDQLRKRHPEGRINDFCTIHHIRRVMISYKYLDTHHRHRKALTSIELLGGRPVCGSLSP